MSYLGHAVVENRHGLVAAAMATQADGTVEREASILLLSEFADTGKRITWGGDKAYDTEEHVALVRELGATPHVAQNYNHHAFEKLTPCLELDFYFFSAMLCAKCW